MRLRFTTALRALARRLPLGWRLGLRRFPALAAHPLGGRLRRAANRSGFGHLQAERTSPLRRPGTPYGERLQRGKEQNVARAAALLDGCVLDPGASFSWHRALGPPVRLRGFAPGPEVHAGRVESGVGGGLCQVSNLLYWLAVHAGMEILERHGHDLDLYPDHERTAPFGCGATVFFPGKDLRFENRLPLPVLFELRLEGDRLVGRARFPRDPGLRWEVVESEHRFFARDGSIWRANRLVRRRHGPAGELSEELLARNEARVLYPVPLHQLTRPSLEVTST